MCPYLYLYLLVYVLDGHSSTVNCTVVCLKETRGG